MRNFLLGLFLGMILATGLTTFAQLVPFDAPLAQQIQGQQTENWLRLNREVEARERAVYRDPLLAPLGPCR